MITTEVTSEQIQNWKKIYSENKNNLVVNRISGKELNDYFVEKYHPTKEAPSQFVDTVILNTKENGKHEPIISAYILAGNIYVGIDLNTGFFQVECEDIDKMKIIWDDLFIVRGLSEEDIENTSYGFNSNNDVVIDNINLTEKGSSFDIIIKNWQVKT